MSWNREREKLSNLFRSLLLQMNLDIDIFLQCIRLHSDTQEHTFLGIISYCLFSIQYIEWFLPVVTLDQQEMILTGSLGKTV